MFDLTMPKVHLQMCADSLAELPSIAAPKPYSVRSYRPGDEYDWCRIETTAGEFPDEETAMTRGFDRYFRADAILLPGRMFFVVDENDRPVATATAWFAGETGMLHWVAVDASSQGKGLSGVAIAAAMLRLRELGYRRASLGTQPASWVAIRMYCRFGFRPVWYDDDDIIAGWRSVYEKMGREFSRELCVESC